MIESKYIKSIAMAAIAAVAVSCTDVLDVNDTGKLSDQAIWSNTDAADAYITASYKIFTDDTQLKNLRTKFWDSFSDITKSPSWDQYGHPYNAFLLQGVTNGDGGAGALECWSDEYNRIRTANVCLSSLKRYGEKFGEDFMTSREAEIRLCRAYSYFRLARVYGGVILRTETSGKNGVSDGVYDEDIQQPRATEAETYRFILDELQFAAKNLPDSNSGSWPKGRATKAFAYGLISRIALFAGEWQEAADAAEECGKATGVDLDPDFANLFSPAGADSPEVLFAIQYLKGNPSLWHLWDNCVSPSGDSRLNDGGAYAEHQPTAELADLYEWKDGTPFSWSNWSDGHDDPFSDREKRFQVTILYNGAKWRGRNIECYADYKNSEGQTVSSADGFAEFKKTGATGGKTCTGYFLRKFLEEDNHTFVQALDKSTTPDLIMRYGEVLLNKAEAYANIDFVGHQEKILECINALRRRVELAEKKISDIPTQEQAMTIIREERAKELAAEGLRFWDLRRWGLAESVIGGKQVHGVKITLNADGSFKYDRIECDASTNRIYPARYKYFSIPLSERSVNKKCTNNPGW